MMKSVIKGSQRILEGGEALVINQSVSEVLGPLWPYLVVADTAQNECESHYRAVSGC